MRGGSCSDLEKKVEALNQVFEEGGFFTDTVAATRVRQAHFLSQITRETGRFTALAERQATNRPYFPFHGRGAIQITWAENYERWHQDAANAALIASLTPTEQALLNQLPHFGTLQAPIIQHPGPTPAAVAARAAARAQVQTEIAKPASKGLPSLLDRLLAYDAAGGLDWKAGLRSAASFWTSHNLNPVTDAQGITPQGVAAVTQIVNRFDKDSLPERKAYAERFRRVFLLHYSAPLSR